MILIPKGSRGWLEYDPKETLASMKVQFPDRSDNELISEMIHNCPYLTILKDDGSPRYSGPKFRIDVCGILLSSEKIMNRLYPPRREGILHSLTKEGPDENGYYKLYSIYSYPKNERLSEEEQMVENLRKSLCEVCEGPSVEDKTEYTQKLLKCNPDDIEAKVFLEVSGKCSVSLFYDGD